MAEHTETIDCRRCCLIPEGNRLIDVAAERADAPASSDILVCPYDDCPRVFLVRTTDQGRLRVVVDGGYVIFRFYQDDVPKIGDVVQSRHGDRFMLQTVELDEKHDVANVTGIPLT